MDKKILIVEDDEHIGASVRAFLLDAGYGVELCATGDEARDALFDEADASPDNYALVILDLMLPGVSGLDLLKELRRSHDTPVLVMTALSDDRHEIGAFDLRADDYITKPFSMQVLLRRVEALLRRSGALQKELRWGELLLIPESFKTFYAGEEIILTVREFEILKLLVLNENRVLSYQTILDKVWGYDAFGNEATLYTHIKNLRLKLPRNIIKTVRGVGYTASRKELSPSPGPGPGSPREARQ